MLCLLLFNAAIDWYVMRQITHRVKAHPRLWWNIELYSAIAITLLLVGAIIVPAGKGADIMLEAKTWLLFGYLSVYIPKFLAVVFDLLASIPRLFGHRRIKALTAAGIFIAAASFLAMWWGALINRFNLQTTEVTVEIADLPPAFDGYRIVQISDMHTGTYDTDTTFISRLVDSVNAIGADAIMFTGDIVNRETSELMPFTGTLSRLEAPDGVFAILGNHDYGDYYAWDTPADKVANMQKLYDAYAAMGFRLMRNETAWLRRGNDSIAVIGVENIGEPPFPVYGSLTKSYPDLSDPVSKILLTHNPSHWVDSISGHDDVRVPLTLSGHTHAMQIEVAGVSPAAMRYSTWGGLYADTDRWHQLYVNIGTGTVGMPMRLGATPEITVLTLIRRR